MDDRGSATLLLPVGMLLMVVLGAIAVDLGQLHAARSDLQHRADAAANDAVTAGLDQAALRAGAGYRLEDGRLRRAARRAALVEPTGATERLEVDVVAVADDRVQVRVTGVVDLLFAPALPGGPGSVTVTASATSEVEIR